MEGGDGLGEAGDLGCRAAELAEDPPGLAEDPPGLEGGDGLFDLGPDLCLGSVDGLVIGGEAVPPAGVREADRAACALVALVRPAGDAGLGESVDDAVLAG